MLGIITFVAFIRSQDKCDKRNKVIEIRGPAKVGNPAYDVLMFDQDLVQKG